MRRKASEVLDEKFEIEHGSLQIEKQDCRDGRDHYGLHLIQAVPAAKVTHKGAVFRQME